MNPPALVLASRSPRRAQLLRDAGFEFSQVDPPFEDANQPGDTSSPAAVLAGSLAAHKAASVLDAGLAGDRPDAVVLGADTIVVDQAGVLTGTPTDREQARDMIERLIDCAHQVVTVVALVAQTCQSAGDLRTQTLVDTATVHLGKVGPDELQRYLDTQQWRGKAGGYNLFERQNHWPLRVEGDPTTVVGLPMRKLVPTLQAWNIEPAGFIVNDFKAGAP